MDAVADILAELCDRTSLLLFRKLVFVYVVGNFRSCSSKILVGMHGGVAS